MDITYRGANALVTGASSGLGVEFARRLAERGANVVLVARRADRLTALAVELEASYGISATTIPFDLARPGAGQELATKVGRIDILVNNAGFGMYGDLVEADAARTTEMVQLNVVTLVDLTRALLPGMVQRGAGVVLNVASTAGYQPTPHLAAYGATKAFVLSFTEAISAETKAKGVRVLALSPGATRTEFFDVAGEEAQVGDFQTAEQVVDVALRTLDKSGAASVISGLKNKLSALGGKVSPRRVTLAISERLMAR